MKHVDIIKNKLIQGFEAANTIAAVYIFGSHAKEKNHAGSDIDIAILLADFDREHATDIKIKYTLFVEELLGHSVDIVLLNEANCILKNQVLKYGLLAVENNPTLNRRFRANAMMDYIDFAQFRKIMVDAMKRRYAGGV